MEAGGRDEAGREVLGQERALSGCTVMVFAVFLSFYLFVCLCMRASVHGRVYVLNFEVCAQVKRGCRSELIAAGRSGSPCT